MLISKIHFSMEPVKLNSVLIFMIHNQLDIKFGNKFDLSIAFHGRSVDRNVIVENPCTHLAYPFHDELSLVFACS